MFTGGLAAAVPGEIRGFWEVHQKYGKLPWSELFEPAIDLCINGHEVTPHLARSLQSYKSRILASSSLSEIFINPATGDVWEAGQTMYRPQLGATFRAIAQNGPDALYNGTLTQGFVDDVQSMGGIITAEDMANYRPTWDEPVVSTFLNDYTVYTPPPPASGALATFMLNVMDEFINSEESALNYHRIIETFKYAYAKRTELADIVYEPSVEEVFFKYFITSIPLLIFFYYFNRFSKISLILIMQIISDLLLMIQKPTTLMNIMVQILQI